MATLAAKARKLLETASFERIRRKSKRCSLCNLQPDQADALNMLLAKRLEPNPPTWRDITAILWQLGIETSRQKLNDHFHDHYNAPKNKQVKR